MRQAIVWITVYVLTFVVLGLTAGGVIPREVQGWIIIALLVLPILAASYWLFWLYIKTVSSRYAIYSMIVFAVLIAVCSCIGFLMSWDINKIGHIYIPDRIPSWDWLGLDPMSMPSVMLSHLARILIFSLWEWILYKGPYIAIALAAVVIILWINLRFKRIASKDTTQSYSRCSGMFSCLGRSLSVMAILWFAVYLCIMPSMIKYSESAYQDTMWYIRDPEENINKIKDAVAEVRADKGFMKTLEGEKPED